MARDAKPDAKPLSNQVLKLYEQRKIKNITTAENYLIKFASTNKNTKKSAIDSFNKKEEGFTKYGLTSKKSVSNKKDTEKKAALKILTKFRDYRKRAL